MKKILLSALCSVFLTININGDTLPDKEFSSRPFAYYVSIRSNGTHICGGSIIADRYILTSAECLYEYEGPLSGLSVSAGMNNRIKQEIIYRIKKAVSHENFTIDTMQNDIALIKTTRKIIFNDRIKAVSLPKRDVPVNNEAEFTSWRKEEKFEKSPNELQYTDLIITDNQICIDEYGSESITSANICATDQLKGTHKGDFGDPLVYRETNTLFGIVSQIQRIESGKPYIFSRVYYFLQWIRNNQH